jgi:L-asparaginase II
MHLPRVVEVWRGPVLESEHRGVAAAVGADGSLIGSIGDPGLVTFPRSSLKPFQALMLLESGAADDLRLDQRRIALACASHHGEAFHLAAIREWLDEIGCSAADLACGAEPPASITAYEALMRNGEGPSPIHHNCSGKHAGFLTVCRHCGWPLEGYAEPAHPAQQRYRSTMGEILERDPGSFRQGTDGCTLPALALSVEEMARACARFAAGRFPGTARRDASGRILDAMRAFPEYVSGTCEPTVQIARATAGRVVYKTGADAFGAVWIPEAGIGVAVKIADGSARARVPFLLEFMARVGLLEPDEIDALEPLRRPIIHDSRGRPVGRLEVAIEEAET